MNKKENRISKLVLNKEIVSILTIKQKLFLIGKGNPTTTDDDKVCLTGGAQSCRANNSTGTDTGH